MLLIPYRVKNPWKRFPYATVVLMAVNVFVYVGTVVFAARGGALDAYAFHFGVTGVHTLFTSLFLHGDLMHLTGNLLFFWVFGPAVEDRLGIPKFLLVYFVAGIVGNLLQAQLDVTMLGVAVPVIGASGCITGVLGAYWWLFSWSTVCVFYFFMIIFRIWYGVWEVQALWIIGLYILLDLIQGFLFGGSSGVANFAHVGGGLAGVLLCLALRAPRDSAEVSQAKHVQAEVKDLSRVPPMNLEIMHRADPHNADILRAILAWTDRLDRLDIVHRAFRTAGPTLAEREPGLVGQYLLAHEGDHTLYTSRHLMGVARHMESASDPRHAARLYEMVITHHASTPEHEVALYRLALCCWDRFQNAEYARAYLTQLLSRYPCGSMEPHARALLRQMGPE